MQAHLVQFDIAWESPDLNFATVDRLVHSASIAAGDLLLLPEMFDSGFSFNVFKTADTGATLEFITDLARRTGCIVHGHRTVMLADGKARNRATVVSPAGTILCEYDKVHLFSYSRETEHLAPGSALTEYAWNTLAVCPAICYDLRFPELFRRGVQTGAGVFALGSCWPAARQHHRRTLALARAIENQAFVLICNRCGSDPAPTHAAYDGHSMIIDPLGAILAEGDENECVVSAAVDPHALSAWRARFPALADMKIAFDPHSHR